MTEAVLVLTGDVEGRVEIETTLRVIDRSTLTGGCTPTTPVG
jgi:hypothetical protein